MSIEQYRSQNYVFIRQMIVSFDEIMEATGNTNKSDANKMKTVDKMLKSRKLFKGTKEEIERVLAKNNGLNDLSAGERISIMDEILSEIDPSRKRINPLLKKYNEMSEAQEFAVNSNISDEGSNLGDLGAIGGTVVGAILGAPISVVGEVLDSDTLRNISRGVVNTTANTGEVFGNIATGSFDTISGLVREDENQKNRGLNQLQNTVGKFGKDVQNTVKSTVNSAIDMKDGIVHNDEEKLKKGAKAIFTTAVAGAIGFGVVEGITDITDSSSESASTTGSIQHVDAHYVEGYTRVDGTPVDGYLRDGDGDTSVHTQDGYIRRTLK